MQPIVEIDLRSWDGPFAAATCDTAVAALEKGQVLLFPDLAFALTEREAQLVENAKAPTARKNITFDPRTRQAHGAELDKGDQDAVGGLLDRFGAAVGHFVDELFPAYRGGVERARATFRPAEIAGREYSPRKDDRRLHVDAFPSRPTGGKRILRVFTNINPQGEPRVWDVGEPFEEFAKAFVARTRSLLPFEADALALTGITKSRRTSYDHRMLQLHDRAKLDAAYQANSPHARVSFAAGSTWMCFTDQVLHAALSGRGVLEQTLLVELARQVKPEQAPLRVLERLTGRTLA